MINEGIFSAVGNAVILGWLVLLVGLLLPRGSRWSARLLFAGGKLLPVTLGAAYLVMFCLLTMSGSEGDLFSLHGIAARFSSRDHLFLLYLEVLTFSLFIGGWIVEDARRREMPRWLVAPILPVQFMFGPIGVLGYIAASRPFSANTETDLSSGS